jgi:hypothetical protein
MHHENLKINMLKLDKKPKIEFNSFVPGKAWKAVFKSEW